jgi:hypothetical protein
VAITRREDNGKEEKTLTRWLGTFFSNHKKVLEFLHDSFSIFGQPKVISCKCIETALLDEEGTNNNFADFTI